MRWHDWLIVISIGALVGGAYFFGRPQPVVLDQRNVDGTYHHVHYLVSLNRSKVIAAALLISATVLHLAVIRRSGIRRAAAGSVAIFAATCGLFLAFAPQQVLSRGGTPRQYSDYSEAFAQSNLIATIGSTLATAALTFLLALTAVTLLRRLRTK